MSAAAWKPQIDWDGIDASKYANEDEVVGSLLASAPLDFLARQEVHAEAVRLVRGARKFGKQKGVVESFLQEFSLGTREGLALMCLAEALLRTPDASTRDRLIAEKISSAEWHEHLGNSDSWFVNASTWGLMLTGKLVEVESEAQKNLSGYLRRIATRLSEPVIRRAVSTAVQIMGEQFVLGRTIEEALKRAKREDYLCSFDMLGEGARTAADAERYEKIYADAIETVGLHSDNAGPELGHGVSVKLSALCARYEAVQEDIVWRDLYPRLLRLAEIASRYDLNLAIDAEEADRLIISLKLFERLSGEPSLRGWNGLGIVVQAYQKRALHVLRRLKDLAELTNRRIMVRLVKGAYWDTEVKRAQVFGREEYPVFSTKPATDLNYLVCAKELIAASPALYPQFATHNAHTLAAVRHMAGEANQVIEHQRLHGMGEALYDAANQQYGKLRLRAYAPVGGHEELLPYLVRRLLENGANTSFVHALLNEAIAPAEVVADPITLVEAHPSRHPRLSLPRDIYGAGRQNPLGRDFSVLEAAMTAKEHSLAARSAPFRAYPIIAGQAQDRTPNEVTSPVDRALVIGTVSTATTEDVDRAVQSARFAQKSWNKIGGYGRAKVLRAMGDALEAEMDSLVALLSLEAGKTLNDGVAEVREAVDFCRYYASEAERLFGAAEILPGPVGESNQLEMQGRGVFGCISPWNFPLAIFTGQITGALAAGNAVLAKPAAQTPLIATKAVEIFLAAGLDPNLIALLPGSGRIIGNAIVNHPSIAGIAFTGGTETAWGINRQLAAKKGPIVPFIAETGGLNGMFVDGTALREQVVDDAILSAFGSAGQRCSALRVIFLPSETAEGTISALKGAMDQLVIGDPALPSTDVGPVIDAAAKRELEEHLTRLKRDGLVLHACECPEGGDFFGPILAEIPAADYLETEVFGPILHVVRYEPSKLEETARKLASRGYGLTLGIHSRIEKFVEEVRDLVPAGNAYVNRAMTGAVVGVQPFGGEGLSGTGPKAGGPHSLLRFATERALSINIMAQGGDPKLLSL